MTQMSQTLRDGLQFIGLQTIGHIDILKLVAPLTKNPNPKSTNFPKRTPFEVAHLKGYHEFARILQTYIKH